MLFSIVAGPKSVNEVCASGCTERVDWYSHSLKYLNVICALSQLQNECCLEIISKANVMQLKVCI